MSAQAPATGLAARLLARADGQVSALRPQIAATYAAAPDATAPIIERTEEIAVGPAPSPPLAPDSARSAAPRTPTDPEPLRLMPEARIELPLPRAVPASVAEAADDAMVAMGEARLTDPRPSAERESAAPPAEPRPQPPRDFPRAQPGERAADSLSAAVLQLLGPAAAAAPPAAASPDRPTPPATAWPGGTDTPSDSPLPAAAAPAGGPPPLHIHIGELVIAPEPRAPQREAAPAAPWAPPLSLAEYRASRERARP